MPPAPCPPAPVDPFAHLPAGGAEGRPAVWRALVDGHKLFAPGDDPVTDAPALAIRRSKVGAFQCGAGAGLRGERSAYLWPERGEVYANGTPLYGWPIGGAGVRLAATTWRAWAELIASPDYGSRAYLVRPVGDVRGGWRHGVELRDLAYARGVILFSGSVLDLGRELVARGLLRVGPASHRRLVEHLGPRLGSPRRSPPPGERLTMILAALEELAAAPPLPPRPVDAPAPGFGPDDVYAGRLADAEAERERLRALFG